MLGERHVSKRGLAGRGPVEDAVHQPAGALYAADGLAARAAYDAFVKKWSTVYQAVAKSLEEPGLELLTFYDFPRVMWKSLRTTNTLENPDREFRRHTKTRASFGTEDAASTIL